VSLACTLAVALLLVNVGASFWNVSSVRATHRWVAHHHRVLTGSHDLLAARKDAEAGQRAYLLAGDRESLRAYESAASAVPRQLRRLKELSDWLHAGERRFLFELLVPATEEQLQRVDGDSDRYDAELRPELMRRAIEAIQGAGIEVDIWKIEGVDEREDAAMLSEQARSGPGREGVKCVVLGRGASTEKVEQWLQQAAPVEGFVGFAIGRSIWWDALKAWLAQETDRETAAAQIAENYLSFVEVYEHQAVH